MENSKASSGEGKPIATAAAAATAVADEENSNNLNASSVTVAVQGGGPDVAVVNEVDNQSRQSSTTRTPFTNLSQVDADLALARTLQEQERAYMMLRMNVDGSDYGSWESENYMHGDDDDFDDQSEDEYGSDADDNDGGDDDDDDDDDDDEDDEEDAVDVHQDADEGDDSRPGVELDPSSFPSDEAYARALQDAEDREMAARLLALAGLNDMLTVEAEETDDDDGGNSQDAWDEIDPDELSYEELLALGEVVGTESRGLSADKIASLPSVNYKTQSGQEGNSDPCVICRLDYEDDDALTVLSCKHSYHSECINNWLRINKVCPVCSAEVSTSGNS